MRAFILRRTRLMSESAGDLMLVSSRHCPGTLQLQDFLTRNGQPYAFLDLDAVSGMCAALGAGARCGGCVGRSLPEPDLPARTYRGCYSAPA